MKKSDGRKLLVSLSCEFDCLEKWSTGSHADGSTAIDTMRKKYTILSPSPGRLPSTVAIAGSIEWVDSA